MNRKRSTYLLRDFPCYEKNSKRILTCLCQTLALPSISKGHSGSVANTVKKKKKRLIAVADSYNTGRREENVTVDTKRKSLLASQDPSHG